MKMTCPQSIKFLRLKRRLAIPHWQVVGVLESLWLFTQMNAPRGDIGKHANEDIAAGLEWSGDADKLIADLCDCGLLDKCDDHRLIVHDWADHMPTYLKGAMAKNGQQVAKQSAKHGARQDQEQAAKQPAEAVEQPAPSLVLSGHSVSVSVSEPTTEKRNGTIPTRYAANSTAEVDNRDALLAIEIDKLSPGSGASLKTIKSLDRHDVANWFCRHIATKAPLVGSTALDLLLVLCCARSCRMSSRRILKPLAAFAADLSEGGWLESAEGCGEEWEWLVGEMKSGRIKFTQQEVAA